MKNEKNIPTRQSARSILDRILLERIENNGDAVEQPLGQDFLELAVNKYVAQD